MTDQAVQSTSASLRIRHADCMAEIAVNRSREAFAELFEFFAPRLKSYLLRLGTTDSEAEDLTQEVMVTVWRKADTYNRDHASVSTWIFRVARNRRIDAQRRANKPALEPDEPLLRPPEAEQPDAVVHRSQMEDIVRAQLERLPPEQVELLQAAFYRGMSHAEIAKAYDIPLGTVKSRIRLAFARLRGGLEEGGMQ